jgi:CRISP-associated protein Cas1
MTTLYIMEPGAYVKKVGQALLVEKDGKRLASRPMKDIETVVLFGGAQASSQALLSLVERGCTVSLLTQAGHFRGSVVAAFGKNVRLRMVQHEKSRDPAYLTDWCRQLVRAKILHSARLLLDYHYSANNPLRLERTDEFTGILDRLKTAKTVESIRGFEGLAARKYFTHLGEALTGGWKFPGRRYYPATDPVNALLSLGYSFVCREIQGLLQAHDFDPYIGFFHAVEYGRPSLALDLVEPFRIAVADRLALRLLNRKVFRPEDFESREGKPGCYLTREGMKVFIRRYEEYVSQSVRPGPDAPTYREVFRQQVEGLKRSLTGRGQFHPFAPED